MKRDMDLIRELLLKVEAEAEWIEELIRGGYTADQALYHASLAVDAGLVKGKVIYGDDQVQIVVIHGLTWDGHEFIDAARNDQIWEKAKELALKASGVLTLEAMKIAVATAVRSLFL